MPEHTQKCIEASMSSNDMVPKIRGVFPFDRDQELEIIDFIEQWPDENNPPFSPPPTKKSKRGLSMSDLAAFLFNDLSHSGFVAPPLQQEEVLSMLLRTMDALIARDLARALCHGRGHHHERVGKKQRGAGGLGAEEAPYLDGMAGYTAPPRRIYREKKAKGDEGGCLCAVSDVLAPAFERSVGLGGESEGDSLALIEEYEITSVADMEM